MQALAGISVLVGFAVLAWQLGLWAGLLLAAGLAWLWRRS